MLKKSTALCATVLIIGSTLLFVWTRSPTQPSKSEKPLVTNEGPNLLSPLTTVDRADPKPEPKLAEPQPVHEEAEGTDESTENEEVSAELAEAREILGRTKRPAIQIMKMDLSKLAEFLKDEAGLTVDLKDPALVSELEKAIAAAGEGKKNFVRDQMNDAATIAAELKHKGKFELEANANRIGRSSQRKGVGYAVHTRTDDDGVRRTYSITSDEYPEYFVNEESGTTKIVETFLKDALTAVHDHQK